MHAYIISASLLQFLILQLQHHIRLFGQLLAVGDDDDALVIFVGGSAQDIDDVGGGGFVQIASWLVRQDDRRGGY